MCKTAIAAMRGNAAYTRPLSIIIKTKQTNNHGTIKSET